MALAPPLGERGDYYRWLFFAAGPLEAAAVNRALGLEIPADKSAMSGYGQFDHVTDREAHRRAAALDDAALPRSD